MTCADSNAKTFVQAVKFGRILYLLGYEFVLLLSASVRHIMCPNYEC